MPSTDRGQEYSERKREDAVGKGAKQLKEIKIGAQWSSGIKKGTGMSGGRTASQRTLDRTTVLRKWEFLSPKLRVTRFKRKRVLRKAGRRKRPNRETGRKESRKCEAMEEG